MKTFVVIWIVLLLVGLGVVASHMEPTEQSATPRVTKTAGGIEYKPSPLGQSDWLVCQLSMTHRLMNERPQRVPSERIAEAVDNLCAGQSKEWKR